MIYSKISYTPSRRTAELLPLICREYIQTLWTHFIPLNVLMTVWAMPTTVSATVSSTTMVLLR